MTHLHKLSLRIFIVVMVLSLAGSIMAQEEDNIFCLDLSEADCAIYTTFQTDMKLPTSTAFDLNVAGNIEIPEEPIAFEVSINGAYATDTAAYQQAVETFGAITLRDVSLGDVVDVIDGIVSAWDAELFIDISGTPAGPMMQGQTIDLYFVDGVAYANLTPAVAIMGDPELEGIYGIDAFEAINFGLSSVTMADVGRLYQSLGDSIGEGGFDPSELDFEELSDMLDEAAAGNPAFAGLQQGLDQAALQSSLTDEDVAAFVTLQRLDDETVNGENVIVFQTDIDLAGVFEVPAIRDVMISNMEMQLDMQSAPDEIDPEALIDAMPQALTDSTFTVIERYSEETGYLVSSEGTMAFNIELESLVSAVGEEMSEGDPEFIAFDFSFNFQRSNINAVESIELPEGAQVIPLMELLGGF